MLKGENEGRVAGGGLGPKKEKGRGRGKGGTEGNGERKKKGYEKSFRGGERGNSTDWPWLFLSFTCF